MRTRLLLVAALGLLPSFGCSSQTPCGLDGGTCIPIAGAYLFTLAETVNCPIWESHIPPSSIMVISQSGSALTAQIWPDTENPHLLTGTLYNNNSMVLSESTQNQLLGIPYATINGTFTATGTGGLYFFDGQFLLEGGGASGTSSGGGTTTTGAGLTCTGGATSITGQEQVSGFLPDAGTILPDAGTPVGDGG